MLRRDRIHSTRIYFTMLIAMLGMVKIVCAHDIRPVYFEIEHDTGHNEINITWKLSLFGNPNVDLSPEISDLELNLSDSKIQLSEDAKIHTWKIPYPEEGLKNKTLTIHGLPMTSTDVMVKINLENETETFLLKPDDNSCIIGHKPTVGEILSAYIKSGIEHIMLGIDHLLFVLGLLLLSKTRWLLFKTITSFTIGHSISLALATFGLIMVPEKPLGAVIALSIVFLAWELVRAEKGKRSLTIKNPWLVSFFFGILHGIGFAGGLTSLGIPKQDIPLALLSFNIGVEIGQLVFIFLALGIILALKRLEFRFHNKVKYIPTYAIGSFACFWFIGRIMDIV